MTVCDSCGELTMDSITICNDCKEDREEFDQRECTNGCGEIVSGGGYCSTGCMIEDKAGEDFD